MTTTINIDCCALWNSFIQNVRLSNDDVLDACSASQCDQFAHIKFMERELQLAISNKIEYTQPNFAMQLTDADFSDLLVHALIGRHFAASSNDDIQQHAYLSFNSMTNRALVIRPLCSFERTIYLVIVVLTILVLVSVIVIQLLRRNVKEQIENSTVHVSKQSENIRKRF